MRSPDTAVIHRAPVQPLVAKELWEIASGRALWSMLLILCPLVGYSFFQAVSLYGEASAAAVDSPVLGSGLSPLDGVLVPTFGGLYLVATLLFPFVLAELREPLIITVHLAPEDPRYVDLRRNVLSKLERVMARVTIRLATSGQSMVGSASEEAYGEVEYSYDGRINKSRSTSHREILPLIYALAQRPIPEPIAGQDYPGYPLLANGSLALAWFLGGLPVLIVLAWWRSRRPPQLTAHLIKIGGQA